MEDASTNSFPGLVELFDGEILGEVFFDKMLSQFDQPHQQYKLATMLQLETETKARLRCLMFSLGLDLRESQAAREQALELAASFEGVSWEQFLSSLNEILQPFVARYTELAEQAPAEHAQTYHSMVAHEQSLLTFTELELEGKLEQSLDAVISQLIYPLPRPVL
jgi:hypothetical protein